MKAEELMLGQRIKIIDPREKEGGINGIYEVICPSAKDSGNPGPTIKICLIIKDDKKGVYNVVAFQDGVLLKKVNEGKEFVMCLPADLEVTLQ